MLDRRAFVDETGSGRALDALSTFGALCFAVLTFVLAIIFAVPLAISALNALWDVGASPRMLASSAHGGLASVLRAALAFSVSTYLALALSGILFARANMERVAIAFAALAGLWGVLATAYTYPSSGILVAFGVALIAGATALTAWIYGRLQP